MDSCDTVEAIVERILLQNRSAKRPAGGKADDVVEPKQCAGLSACYEWLKTNEQTQTTTDDTLHSLLVHGVHMEQLWQQVDAQNKSRLKRLHRSIKTAKLSVDSPDETSNLLKQSVVTSPDDADSDAAINQSNIDMDVFDDNDPCSDQDDDENEGHEHNLKSVNGAAGKSRSSNMQQRQYKSPVDDHLFSLADMDAFCDESERRMEQMDNGEDVEDFLDLDGEDEDGDSEGTGAEYKYGDFFDAPCGVDDGGKGDRGKHVSFDVSDEEEAEDYANESEDGVDGEEEAEVEGEDNSHTEHNEPGQMTEFDKRQQRLRDKISEFESENLPLKSVKVPRDLQALVPTDSSGTELVEQPKSWQMSGEVSNTDRGRQTSLLEEHLAYDRATRAAPVITADLTTRLETLVKQRIKDKAFDDVQRKYKPKTDAKEFRNELVLDSAKPKESLAEVYEKEYIKQTQTEEKEEKNAGHERIRELMTELFGAMDQLSHFNYTPKSVGCLFIGVNECLTVLLNDSVSQASTELRVVSNLRSIEMEEVAPVVTSEHTLLAPEEVKAAQSQELAAKEERTVSERKRERRHKKSMQKAKAQRQAANPSKYDLTGLGKVTRVKADDTDKPKHANSSVLFAKLQQQVGQTLQKEKSINPNTKRKSAALANGLQEKSKKKKTILGGAED